MAPLLSTFGAASVKSFGGIGAGAGGSSAFSLVYTTSTNDSPYTGSVNLNRDGTKILWAFTNSTASDGYVGYLGYLDIETLDPDWEKEMENSGGGSYKRCGYNAAAEISTGTIFAIGFCNYRTDGTTTDVFTQLINASNGASLDADRDTGYSASTVGFRNLVWYPSIEHYVGAAGQFDSGLIGSGDMHCAGFRNNSGTIVDEGKAAYGDSLNDEGGGLAADSSGGSYIGISRLIVSPDVSRYAGVIHVNSPSATIQWYREYSSGNTINDLQYTRAVAVDSQNKVLITGKDNSEMFIAKMQSSDGANIGQLHIDDSDGTIEGHQIITDSSDNIYTAAISNGTVKVMRFTGVSSGASDLDWAVKVSINGSTSSLSSGSTMALSETKETLYIYVYTGASGGRFILLGLPLDGSFTGDLGEVNIADTKSTLTVTTGSLTNQAASGSRQLYTGGVSAESDLEYANATRYTETLTEG